MKQKKRIMLLAVISLMATLLIAWKLKPVELIDDKLLIELDVTIQDADWGQENSGEDADTPGVKDDDSTPVIVPTAAPEDLEEITILIRGEREIVRVDTVIGNKIGITDHIQQKIGSEKVDDGSFFACFLLIPQEVLG